MILAAGLAAAETRVRVTGIEGLSESELLALMAGRLEHVRKSPASPPLADDAAFILRRILRNDGYNDAEVEWRIGGPEEIELQVKQGGRLTLGEVTVTGTDGVLARRLAALYSAPAVRGRSNVTGTPPFREADVEAGLASIRQDLNARGYWDAEARVVRRETRPSESEVDLVIEVREGPRFTIGEPRVTSVDGRGVKLTGGAVRPFAGRPASTRHINAMRLAAEELAISRGYPDARIRMGRSLENGRFIPEFGVDLGGRVKLRQLDITGLEITRRVRIESRTADMIGDWYDTTTMNRRLREFLATGAFQSARVDTQPAGHRLVDATLHFQETRAREVSIAAGIDSYLGFITRVTYANRNFLGRLMELSTGAELSARGALGEVRLTDPWLWGTDIAATLRAHAVMHDREGYDSYETGLSGGIKWKPDDHYSLDVLLATSFVNLSTDGLPMSELGETVYMNPRLRFTQRLDFRDSTVLPKNGWHLEWPLEIGAAVGDLSTAYLRTGLSGGWYRQINRSYDIGVGGDMRLLMPAGDGADLPIELRLFNGGARSVRSFPERELGPTVNGYPTGGEAMWNINTELTRRITESVRAVAFVDAGSLARDYDAIGSAEIEVAAGLGLRLDLPVGPVRLEYGYNLTRDSGEPAGTLHFAIGMAY
ncbi:MAG TPA: BamA/TamA family outer membrane protein [Luteolibacter sp.]|nr:BamA/TamA family outer membrane protein [Luteolibacter sp.]